MKIKNLINILLKKLGHIAYNIGTNKAGIFNFLIFSFIIIYLLEATVIDLTIVEKILNKESEMLDAYISIAILIFLCVLIIQVILTLYLKERVIIIEKILIYYSIALLLIWQPIILICILITLIIIYIHQRKRAQVLFQKSINNINKQTSCCTEKHLFDKNQIYNERAISVSKMYGVPVKYTIKCEDECHTKLYAKLTPGLKSGEKK